MKGTQRRIIVKVSNIIALLWIISLVLFITHAIPMLYFWLLSYHTDGGSGTIPLYLMTFLYYGGTVVFSFNIGVLLFLLRPATRIFSWLKYQLYPPHWETRTPEFFAPITVQQYKTGKIRSLQIAIGAFSSVLVYHILLMRFGYTQAPFYLESILERINGDQLEFIQTFITIVFGIPLGQIEEQFIGEMNQSSVAFNIILLWIPAAFLSIGVLNLLSFLYNWFRREIYCIAIALNYMYMN